MMVAHEFIHEFGSINFVLSVVGLSKSTFYYKPQATGSRGKRISTHTRHRDGYVVHNDVVLQAIRFLFEQEFVDYGYHKVTIWLQRCGLIINKKKVYRLMRAALLAASEAVAGQKQEDVGKGAAARDGGALRLHGVRYQVHQDRWH